MSEDYTIWEVVGGGIHAYNTLKAGDQGYQRLCYVLYVPDGSVAGGLVGATFWDWFYIDLLFVKEELRGQGYGRQLLELAEAEASRRGAKNAYLDTFSFQAPEFYTGQGYRVFGELPDFPVGHTRYFMTKGLATSVRKDHG
jgi:GNAT superfamily N-acetyltransferase